MAESSLNAHVRLFVALPLAADARSAIAGWQSAALDPEAWRAVPEENLHVTLAFLGDVPSAEVDSIGAAIGESVLAGRVEGELCPNALGIPRRRARAVGFELRSESVVQLADRLARTLTAVGLRRRETRPFWPHLTVARARRRPRPPRQAPSSLPPLAPDAVSSPLVFDELVLFRSETIPTGARYSAERRVRLGAI